jgi:hypothetical protein
MAKHEGFKDAVAEMLIGVLIGALFGLVFLPRRPVVPKGR